MTVDKDKEHCVYGDESKSAGFRNFRHLPYGAPLNGVLLEWKRSLTISTGADLTHSKRAPHAANKI
jgi:hypothetical protein